MAIEHRKMPLVLESYELEEVHVPWGPEGKLTKVVRITLHGKNIFMRALEPIVRVGDIVVQYPEIQPDEQRIIGYLKEIPEDGAPITIGYGKQPQVRMKERFKTSKIKKI